MFFSSAALAAMLLMQVDNPIFGSFAPRQETSMGAATIERERIAFESGLVLETTTESGGPFAGAMACGAVAGSEPLIPNCEPAFTGYFEIRKIDRHTGDASALCDGRVPTHVIVTAFSEGISIDFLRKTLFSTRRCGILRYRQAR
jgi:hypothetical protein